MWKGELLLLNRNDAFFFPHVREEQATTNKGGDEEEGFDEVVWVACMNGED